MFVIQNVPPNLQFHGNPNLIIHEKGDIYTDPYGVETCNTVFLAPMNRFDLVPALFSSNPSRSYLVMEKRRVSISPEGFRGFLVITGEYVGIPADTRAVYEVSVGVGEEPIETHPNFVSTIAGTPSAPLNGAVFLDEQGNLSTDNAKGIFSKFRSVAGSDKNPFAGISSYLEADQITFRKSWASLNIVSGIGVGKIRTPDGPAPTLNGGNWLLFSVTSQQRGLMYFNTIEWRASGTKGWNTTIYGG